MSQKIVRPRAGRGEARKKISWKDGDKTDLHSWPVRVLQLAGLYVLTFF